MKQPITPLAGALALIGFAFLGTALAGPAQQDARAALERRVHDTLGLSAGLVGDLRRIPVSEPGVRYALEFPGTSLLFDLTPHSVRAASFEVRAQLEDGSWTSLPPQPLSTYRGRVIGEDGSQVAASLLEDGLHARVRLADGQEFWVEPIAPRVDGARPGQHVLYQSHEVLEGHGTCAADLVASFSSPGTAWRPKPGPGSLGNDMSVTAEIACDTDFEYFSQWGSGTQARIESVINALNLQYSSEVGISHMITTILIRTSSSDPYTKKVADQLLNEFRQEWNNNQGGVQRDVAHLFTGRSLAGSTIGIAYLNAVCNLGIAYGLVQSDFNGNFACVTDLSAHELGHNWGANHCSCSTYTMNASITCANRFNPAVTIPAITAYRDSQSCFGAPPATGSIAGTVTSFASGAAIAGATVQVDSGQSDTTDGSGNYTITGVPTGTRTVTASAVGFVADNTTANVTEGQTTQNVDFALETAPAGSQAIVDCITYSSSGGPNQDRNLYIEVTVVDDGGAPVAGASVSVSVDLNGAPFGSATASTDSNGMVTFQARNSPNGCYETDVTGLSAAGLTFDGTEPMNGFAKGSDSSPDADCRSGSDACGAG